MCCDEESLQPIAEAISGLSLGPVSNLSLSLSAISSETCSSYSSSVSSSGSSSSSSSSSSLPLASSSSELILDSPSLHSSSGKAVLWLCIGCALHSSLPVISS